MDIRIHAKRIADQIARIPTTLLITLATLATACLPGVAQALQYDRAQIAAGEVWRLATCHATHWNIEHLQWDLLMFLGLGGVCEWRTPRRMRFCLAAAAAGVTATVFCFFPDVSLYRGLSGLDTALFTLLAVQLFNDAGRAENRPLSLLTGIMFTGFCAKTAFEAVAGQTVFVDEQIAGFIPLVWDHVAGGTSGAITAISYDSRGSTIYRTSKNVR
jgi:rhomboid family GlyGly-CTERM serine protease